MPEPLGRCATCAWWETDWKPALRPHVGWGSCAAMTSWMTTDAPAPDGAQLVVTVQNDAVPQSPTYQQTDYLRGYADLWTAPAFGCVQWAPRPAPADAAGGVTSAPAALPRQGASDGREWA